MKKSLINFLFLLLSSTIVTAQITGLCLLAGPNDHSGIKVTASSPNSVFKDTAYTDIQGNYSMKVPSGNYFLLFAKDGFDSIYYNNGQALFMAGNEKLETITLQDKYKVASLRLSADVNSISGTVRKGTNLVTSGAVYATDVSIPRTYMGKINSDGTFKVDSTSSGRYQIYAVPASAQGLGYSPTYYVNKLKMSDATIINGQGVVTGIDLYLVQQTTTETGSASIEGRFNFGDGSNDERHPFNKTWFNYTFVPSAPINQFGDPCKNLPVLLYNNAGKIVGNTVTDLQGYYTFKNLAGGNYRLEGQKYDYTTEFGGFINVQTTGITRVALHMMKPIVTFIPQDRPTSADTAPFPNPFQNTVEIANNGGRISITDLAGKKYYESGASSFSDINTTDWPEGVYLVITKYSHYKLIKKL